jgi:hypothetical protein
MFKIKREMNLTITKPCYYKQDKLMELRFLISLLLLSTNNISEPYDLNTDFDELFDAYLYFKIDYKKMIMI